MDYFATKKIVRALGNDADQLSGKTVLWTGTGGFLGAFVIEVFKYLNEHVLDIPCRLLAYDMHLPKPTFVDECEKLNISFYAHDLTTKLPAIKSKIDFVVHMAGIASPHHYQKRPLQTIDVALEGSRSALEIAKANGARYLFTSSSEVYQTADVIPTPETYVGAISSVEDRSCYDVSIYSNSR